MEGTSRGASTASSRELHRLGWITRNAGMRPLQTTPTLSVYYFCPSVSLIAASFFGLLWSLRPKKVNDVRLALWLEQLPGSLVLGCFWAFCDDLAALHDSEAFELGVSAVAEGWYDPELDYWSEMMRRCCTALGVRYQQLLRRREFEGRMEKIGSAALDYTARDVAAALDYEVADDKVGA